MLAAICEEPGTFGGVYKGGVCRSAAAIWENPPRIHQATENPWPEIFVGGQCSLRIGRVSPARTEMLVNSASGAGLAILASGGARVTSAVRVEMPEPRPPRAGAGCVRDARRSDVAAGAGSTTGGFQILVGDRYPMARRRKSAAFQIRRQRA